MKYYKPKDCLSEFLSLKCAGDVLNVVSPLGTKAKKEITESMSIIKQLRRIVMKEPMKYALMDLCAGNALTSIIAIHLLPIKYAYAFDKRSRKRKWKLAKRFEYCIIDIYDKVYDFATMDENSIIIAIHPCSKLAERVIDIYLENKNTKHLLLMPCCHGKVSKDDISYYNEIPKPIKNKLNRYERWCWYLARKAGGTFIIDESCLSPKNGIIIASKE